MRRPIRKRRIAGIGRDRCRKVVEEPLLDPHRSGPPGDWNSTTCDDHRDEPPPPGSSPPPLGNPPGPPGLPPEAGPGRLPGPGRSRRAPPPLPPGGPLGPRPVCQPGLPPGGRAVAPPGPERLPPPLSRGGPPRFQSGLSLRACSCPSPKPRGRGFLHSGLSLRVSPPRPWPSGGRGFFHSGRDVTRFAWGGRDSRHAGRPPRRVSVRRPLLPSGPPSCSATVRRPPRRPVATRFSVRRPGFVSLAALRGARTLRRSRRPGNAATSASIGRIPRFPRGTVALALFRWACRLIPWRCRRRAARIADRAHRASNLLRTDGASRRAVTLNRSRGSLCSPPGRHAVPRRSILAPAARRLRFVRSCFRRSPQLARARTTSSPHPDASPAAASTSAAAPPACGARNAVGFPSEDDRPVTVARRH